MRAIAAIGSMLVLALCVSVTVFSNTPGNLYPSEYSYLTTQTSWAQGNPMLIYVYLTNRPYNVTHGPTSANASTTTTPEPPDDLLGPGGDIWKKALFIPTVDTLTRFWLGNTTQWYLVDAYTDLVVYVQFGQNQTSSTVVKSTRKHYWKPGYIVGSWGVNIGLTQGVVTSITWDDGCQECTADQCLDNVCAIPENLCQGTVCDMKFYVGWSGTDSNGAQLISAGELPSNFRTLSFGQRYLEAAGLPESSLII